ncbi:X-ray repair cross-complementing protein 5-like [Corticium candelabrum]|uniref:X-ray repair cross-complementing protein 5-like n=1 Tax=Corticium candelabrum TaxID=121492 RepID=UPI002E25CCB0|nr:X-ray repair cross-complementing protein 5-like [Corticium candelabrum]
MGIADLDFVRYLNSQIIPGNTEADFVDALVVAMDHLHTSTQGKKLKPKLLMFTDCGSPANCNPTQLKRIVSGLQQLDADFKVIGPSISLDDDDDDASDTENGYGGGTAASSACVDKQKTRTQIEGESLLKKIIQSVKGDALSFHDALGALSHLSRRQVRQTSTFRGPLEIGSSLKINVWAYIRVKSEKPISFKKLSAVSQASANPATMAVKMDRTHHLNDEDESEVMKEQVISGYWYGKDLVPFLSVDQQQMKFKSPKCLKVLGFTKLFNVPHHIYIGDSTVVFVPAPGDEQAAVALSALIHALEETGMGAIVKYAFRNNVEPKIGVLTAHIKLHYECLIFTQLPFAEDVRQYTFASLDTKKHEPSEEQKTAIDDLITSMDLTHGVRDDDGDFVEAFEPKKTFNPVLQRMFQCIRTRALNPDDALPDLDPLLAEYVQPPRELLTICEQQLEKIKELFPLEKVEKKTRKEDTTAAAVWKDTPSLDLDAPDAPPAKAMKIGDESELSMAVLSKAQVKEVGTVDPVGDFKSLISCQDVDMFDEACQQMVRRITQLVFDSFGDQFYSKALECMHALREAAVKLREPDVFNSFLRELKSRMTGRSAPFWQRVKAAGISLITSAEANDSTVSRDEAREFLTGDEKKEEIQPEPEETDDTDDLLAMM